MISESKQFRHRSVKVLYIILVLLAVVAGTGLRLYLNRYTVTDYKTLGTDGYGYYISAGIAFLEGRGLDPAYNHRDPAPPLFVPPPLQQLYIALVFWLRGGEDVMAIYYGQLILNLLAGGVLFGILWRWRGSAAALIGLWGWMLYPEFAFWHTRPMAESNYFLLMLLTLGALAGWSRRPHWGWALGAALLIGVMNLQRPTGFFLGVALVPLALWRVKSHRRWLHAAILLVVPFLVLAPWMLRNKRVTGDPVWVSSNGGILLYAVNNIHYDALKYPDYFKYPGSVWAREDVAAEFWSKEYEGRRTTYQLGKLYQREFRRYLLEHPLHFARNYAIKFGQRFVLYPDHFGWTYRFLEPYGNRLIFYGLLALGIAGLIGGRRAWCDPIHFTMAWCFLYYAAFNALFNWLGNGRLTLSLRVYLLLFAAAGLGMMLQTVAKNTTNARDETETAPKASWQKKRLA